MAAVAFYRGLRESVVVRTVWSVAGPAQSSVAGMIPGIVGVVTPVTELTPIRVIHDAFKVRTTVVVVFILDDLYNKRQVPFTPKDDEEGVTSADHFELIGWIQTIQMILELL